MAGKHLFARSTHASWRRSTYSQHQSEVCFIQDYESHFGSRRHDSGSLIELRIVRLLQCMSAVL